MCLDFPVRYPAKPELMSEPGGAGRQLGTAGWAVISGPSGVTRAVPARRGGAGWRAAGGAPRDNGSHGADE
jgi:hypothetical protein